MVAGEVGVALPQARRPSGIIGILRDEEEHVGVREGARPFDHDAGVQRAHVDLAQRRHLVVLGVQRIALVAHLGAVVLAAVVGVGAAGQRAVLQLFIVVQSIAVRVFAAVVLADDQLAAPLPIVGHAVLVRVVGAAALLATRRVEFRAVDPEAAVPLADQ